MIVKRYFVFCLLFFVRTTSFAQQYNHVFFYVCAHQDDWQLFMGANAFNDINAFDEKKAEANGKKVVFIFTTAGNLDDSDDTRTCNCIEGRTESRSRIPYWQVREKAVKNSIHFAAARIGGWGSAIPYPENKTALINGHRITKYTYKNTVSYFLRMKTNQSAWWYNNGNMFVGTVDNSTRYMNMSDLQNTICAIYKTEMESEVTTGGETVFNFPEINETINPNDHPAHIIAGRSAYAAAKMLARQLNACYPMHLFIDYHSEKLPVNISEPDVQNEAGLVAVYCLALLDYNAWPEWGDSYRRFSGRNYFRTVNTCDKAQLFHYFYP